MLVIGAALQDRIIRELPQLLSPGDVMVFNDTRVIPARLAGRRGEARIEILLHKDLGEGRWRCFAKPARKLRPGDIVQFAEDFSATVQDRLESGEVVLAFDSAHFMPGLLQHGQMPLPPYIEKHRKAGAADRGDYQTLYARHDGSVAAPTAGLHFTEALLAAIDATGVRRVFVTLHVGGGTFLPVKAEDTKDHAMHSEYAVVSPQAAQAINEARSAGRRVIAVGTTSLRTLESAATQEGLVMPFAQDTRIFITPGYRFRVIDALLTNFHLPRSTLFMLVSAIAGLDTLQAAYKHAISMGYRFYSYGDACFIPVRK